jgi:hypothetical protein
VTRITISREGTPVPDRDAGENADSSCLRGDAEGRSRQNVSRSPEKSHILPLKTSQMKRMIGGVIPITAGCAEKKVTW